MSAPQPEPQRQPQPQPMTWAGRPVIDPAGERVGVCGAVLLANPGVPAEWLLLYGVSDGQSRLAPIAGAHAGADGVVLGYPAARVVGAPPVRSVRDLGAHGLARQRSHYGLAAAAARGRLGALSGAVPYGPLAVGVAGLSGAAAGVALSWWVGRRTRRRAAVPTRAGVAGAVLLRGIAGRGFPGLPNTLGLVVLIWRIVSAWRRRRSLPPSRPRSKLVRALMVAWRAGIAATRLLRRLYRLFIGWRRRRSAPTRTGSPTTPTSRSAGPRGRAIDWPRRRAGQAPPHQPGA